MSRRNYRRLFCAMVIMLTFEGCHGVVHYWYFHGRAPWEFSPTCRCQNQAQP